MNESTLMKSRDRLAVAGEELVVYRFGNGSTGLLSCRDYDRWTLQRKWRLLRWLRGALSSRGQAGPGPRICVPPGSWLRLIGIPEVLRDRARGCPDAIFLQISTQSGLLCDALALAYGNTMLRFVPQGQRLKILSLSSASEAEPELNELEPVPLAGA